MSENMENNNLQNENVTPAEPVAEPVVEPVVEPVAPAQPVYSAPQPPKAAPVAPAPAKAPGNGLAIAALICGILGVVTACCCIGGLPAILAVIFGIIAMAKKTPKKGLALTGLILGAVSIILSLVMLIVFPLMVEAGVFDEFMDTVDGTYYTDDYYTDDYYTDDYYDDSVYGDFYY